MKAIHQLSTFLNILEQYNLDQPLHRFLTQHYRQNKQMGAKDRKIANRLTYNYFRIGAILPNQTPEKRLMVAEFLCNDQINSFLAHYQPTWESKISLSINDKITFLKKEFPDFKLNDVFPFAENLSVDINRDDFFKSFFIQPDLFIRIKRGQEKRIIKILTEAEIRFNQIDEHTLALANGTKLDVVIPDKGIFEVQDISSQKVGAFFQPKKWDKWWDCCAASGGKSLMLYDEEPDIKLLVSDNRESILENLQQRFAITGLRNYQKKIMDLTQSQALFLHDYIFDGIILDAPCSGSGTWGRTPEMISLFEDHKIKFFADLQRKITTHVIPYLKVAQPLVYITCSVFKQENEEQVDWICKQFEFKVECQQLIMGYKNKADTMFVARLIKL